MEEEKRTEESVSNSTEEVDDEQIEPVLKKMKPNEQEQEEEQEEEDIGRVKTAVVELPDSDSENNSFSDSENEQGQPLQGLESISCHVKNEYFLEAVEIYGSNLLQDEKSQKARDDLLVSACRLDPSFAEKLLSHISNSRNPPLVFTNGTSDKPVVLTSSDEDDDDDDDDDEDDSEEEQQEQEQEPDIIELNSQEDMEDEDKDAVEETNINEEQTSADPISQDLEQD